MKKVIIFICFFICMFFIPMHSKTIEEFAGENKLRLISCNMGNIEQSDDEQMIAIFKIIDFNDYKAIYFRLKKSEIIFKKEIEQFHHCFATSAFDKEIGNKNNSLVILKDLDGDSFDEIILDYGLEDIFPLVLKYTNQSFVQILNLSGYPNSNVVLPGAPNIYEVWKLISYGQGEIILKRCQSDLAQYVTFTWNSSQTKFLEKRGYNYFENTGFATSNERDFEKIQKELDNNYLEKLSSKQLRILRNAIYAKYGRKFSSWDLVDNFAQCKWYVINPNFSEDVFSEIDILNIRKIKSIEQRKGIYKPITWDLEFFKD